MLENASDIPQVAKKNYDILIVDDVPANLELLSNILFLEDYEISFANDGQQALEAVSYQAPDLILLDISMPGMDGYEVCRRLKADDKTKDIPIIFLTALSDTENVVQGFQSGGQDYVTKPFNAEELLARVKTHLELKEKKKVLEIYAAKLEKLNQQQSQLNQQLQDQKTIIEQKNKDLTASIDYAKIIQDSFLPDPETFDDFFDDNLLFFRAKDIVSGDFYYFDRLKSQDGHETIVVAAADCTGHGVPGALLSMLGTSLLNQIIFNDKVSMPAEILQQLDLEFRQMLVHRGKGEKSGDGMDIAICAIIPEADKLIFSGCKRPLFIIRQGEVIYKKGSLHPIGGFYHSKESFHNHEVSLQKGDRIYLFSDGYTDQFGGDRGKKLTTRRFRELLIDLQDFPLKQQGTKLREYFEQWQGDREQVDDVLVLGFSY